MVLISKEFCFLLLFCGDLFGLAICRMWSKRDHMTSEYLLYIHNKFRRSIARGKMGFTVGDMKQMNWDPKLEAEAKKWASCGNIGRQWFNSEYDELALPLRGLNTAIGKQGSTLYSLVKTWFQERLHYDREFNACFHGQKCNNFMQLVSAKTDKLGCAINTNCRILSTKVNFLVCVYAPGLNEADAIFKIGKPCSKCETPAAFCENDLCARCNKVRPGECDCRKTCSKGDVKYGVLDQEGCTCSCTYGGGPNCDEECRNPEQYLDYDICGFVTEEECMDGDPETRQMLREFCPEQCACKRPPLV